MNKDMTREEAIARIKDHKIIHKIYEGDPRTFYISKALDMAIESLEQESQSKSEDIAKAFQIGLAIGFGESTPKTGQWLRLSNLSEKEDNRYKCSRCGNVVYYKNKMDLYTFNGWCNRCGSDNRRKIEVDI